MFKEKIIEEKILAPFLYVLCRFFYSKISLASAIFAVLSSMIRGFISISEIFGYFFTKSSLHNLKQWSYNLETGQILSYENSTDTGNLNTFNYNIGIQFQYTFHKNYFMIFPFGNLWYNIPPNLSGYYRWGLLVNSP
jgi:hypothetical protein